jgi:dCTP deaminase
MMQGDEMKLLNDEMLCSYVNRPDPLLVKDLPEREDWFDKDSPVQPSSIDLHIGSILLPGTKLGMDGSEERPLSTRSLGPGETAIITTLETLNLPSNVAAIGFPPSSVSKQGLLMTNPGHVDPGYVGPMHFTVINMGREEFSLRKGAMIVTLLFFEMSSPVKRDYSARNPSLKVGLPRQEEINQLSADFLDFTKRAKTIAKEEAQSFEIKRTIIAGFVSVALLAATYFVPLWTGVGDLKERVGKLEQAQTLVGLDRRVTALENRAGQPTSASPNGSTPSQTQTPRLTK